MTKLRRALIAILTFIGITVGSLGVSSAAAPPPAVTITAVTTCLADGWKVDYTAVSSNTTPIVPAWKVELSTPGWLPTINTYQANTIPYTRSTGVLPFSQATTPLVQINVEWTNDPTATDTEGPITHQCEVVAPTTVAPPTTAPGVTVVVDLTTPVTTVSPVTVPDTIVAIVADPCVIDEFCFEQPSTTEAVVAEFPVTGKGDGGLLIGGILLTAGAGALLVSRRRPKNA